jgi:hypothetical protein
MTTERGRAVAICLLNEVPAPRALARHAPRQWEKETLPWLSM